MLFEGVLAFVNNNPLYEVTVEENEICVTYRTYVRHIYEERSQKYALQHVLVYVMTSTEKYPLDYMEHSEDYKVDMQYTTERTIAIDERREKVDVLYPLLVGIQEDEYTCLVSKHDYDKLKDESRTSSDEFILYKYKPSN